MKPSTNSKVNMPIISRAKGKYCVDINGRKFLDFTGSNLTVIHGYRPRLSVVPNYPGPSEIESKLSQLLRQYTNTKYFRYYKNGSDAVNNAVRYARHLYPGAKVTYIGYAGSHDLYAYTVNANGIVEQNSRQIKDFSKLPKKTDILVYESRYQKLANKIDSYIRICDYLKSGVMGLYDLQLYDPDFKCYGKSLGNGSAIAVLTGRDEHMINIDDVYYSTTFGSNPDGMIEAIRTIKDFEKVKDRYFNLYKYAQDKLPKWQTISIDRQIDFMDNGILFNGFWQIFTIHTKKDIDRLAKLCNNLL
jgi:glutamate-1-semialdehyde 2,1-aminomutase